MVCVPCIVIPLVLWFFHKYIQPYISKIWNPWKSQEKIEDSKKETKERTTCCNGVSNGLLANGHVTAGDGGGDTENKKDQ
ncbi:hypothetical protein CHS0354_022318 [Potamilus streckersoni]|uniref:Uncharacterized protein n=1 Tax=Potamilus streckersoni TaxID=2493646 RepID=A0AAE0TH52_9BIVA|nr:hypothetical protein CHS0354_022318 [Potamilus streckersoni]